MSVKKLIAITTLCAAALCSGTLISASAEEGLNIPDNFVVDFTLENVDDYAVGSNQYAFADGNDVYVYTVNTAESSGYSYSGGELTVYEHSSAVTAVEYSDGNLYFSDGTGAYLYSNGAATSAEFTFTEFDDSKRLDSGEYLYYINSGNLVLYHYDNASSTVLDDAAYSCIKQIGDSYYILKDSTLCALSGGVLSEMSFSYEDYTVGSISTAGTAEAISAKTDVQLAAVPQGACIIRVDEDYLDEDYFTVLNITFAEEDMTAQVLYYPDSDGGNAALIAVGAKTYLTLKTNLTVSAYSPEAISSDITTYYLLDGASVYSIPYESGHTAAATLEKDAVVTVTGYVSGDAFDYNYYKVEYTADGATASGYVIAGLLTPYTFDNDNVEQEVLNDGDQSYDNNNFTIILVMVIVVLVLIAAGYVTIVATSDKKKRNKRK